MEMNDFLDRVNIHTKAIYENEIEQVKENGRNVYWLLGLASGALLFSLNKYGSIDSDNTALIFIQAIVFIAIIMGGYMHRIKTKAFNQQIQGFN